MSIKHNRCRLCNQDNSKFLNDSDLRAIWLTVGLAGIVTLILLLLGTPIA